MEHLWQRYLELEPSLQITIWLATIATLAFLLNFFLKPVFQLVRSKFFNPQTTSRKEIEDGLINLLNEADQINQKYINREMGLSSAESELVQWKIKVIRYLEKYVGVTEAEQFLNLRTTLGAAQDLGHYKSSYKNPIHFLNGIKDRLKKGKKSKLKVNNHSLSLGVVKFIYR